VKLFLCDRPNKTFFPYKSPANRISKYFFNKISLFWSN